MRLLARYPDPGIVIRLADDVDPETPVGDVFAEPVRIEVVQVSRGGQVRLGIEAPTKLTILHEEVVSDSV